jgi:hypothetical protein
MKSAGVGEEGDGDFSRDILPGVYTDLGPPGFYTSQLRSRIYALRAAAAKNAIFLDRPRLSGLLGTNGYGSSQ